MPYSLLLATAGTGVKGCAPALWGEGNIGKTHPVHPTALPKTKIERNGEAASTSTVCDRTDKVMVPISPA
jgi:hypothetical protein